MTFWEREGGGRGGIEKEREEGLIITTHHTNSWTLHFLDASHVYVRNRMDCNWTIVYKYFHGSLILSFSLRVCVSAYTYECEYTRVVASMTGVMHTGEWVSKWRRHWLYVWICICMFFWCKYKRKRGDLKTYQRRWKHREAGWNECDIYYMWERESGLNAWNISCDLLQFQPNEISIPCNLNDPNQQHLKEQRYIEEQLLATLEPTLSS